MKSRRGQEEMVGFALIVVIVAIIFLILLGIFVRKAPSVNEKASQDVEQFLGSMLEYSSDCTTSYEPDYSNIARLMRECHNNEVCKSSGLRTCEVLNREAGEIVKKSWNIGPESPYKGYVIDIAYNSTYSSEEIAHIQEGECEGSIIGGEQFISDSPGVITITLKICK